LHKTAGKAGALEAQNGDMEGHGHWTVDTHNRVVVEAQNGALEGL